MRTVHTSAQIWTVATSGNECVWRWMIFTVNQVKWPMFNRLRFEPVRAQDWVERHKVTLSNLAAEISAVTMHPVLRGSQTDAAYLPFLTNSNLLRSERVALLKNEQKGTVKRRSPDFSGISVQSAPYPAEHRGREIFRTLRTESNPQGERNLILLLGEGQI